MMDFKKAFDRIKHKALWKSLEHYGIDPAYVELLTRLCSQQEGTVLTERKRRVSDHKRHEARGSDAKPTVNTVLQFSLEEDLKKWQEKQKGIRLTKKKKYCLRNLRFADDVMFVSTSVNKFEDVMCDFKRSTEAAG